jgi:hypothetical protein
VSRRYPTYDVLDKWSSVSFDNVTRGVLRQRLHALPERRFFTPDEWALMEAIAAHLAPPPERGGVIPIVPWIDADLEQNRGEGYRHPDMPPLREAWRKGLAGFAAEARARYGRSFVALDPGEQAAQLRRVQAGEVDAAHWDGVDAGRFFTDMLLKAVVGVYYAHPAAWSEMGFGGPASPRGYVRIGLDERDPWEAREAEARK